MASVIGLICIGLRSASRWCYGAIRLAPTQWQSSSNSTTAFGVYVSSSTVTAADCRIQPQTAMQHCTPFFWHTLYWCTHRCWYLLTQFVMNKQWQKDTKIHSSSQTNFSSKNVHRREKAPCGTHSCKCGVCSLWPNYLENKKCLFLQAGISTVIDMRNCMYWINLMAMQQSGLENKWKGAEQHALGNISVTCLHQIFSWLYILAEHKVLPLAWRHFTQYTVIRSEAVNSTRQELPWQDSIHEDDIYLLQIMKQLQGLWPATVTSSALTLNTRYSRSILHDSKCI